MLINEKFLDLNFRLTWMPIQEKIKPRLLKRKRMTIDFCKLPELIGEKETILFMSRLLKLKAQSRRYKIPNKGIIDVYSK
jgi:hypothetical protein